MKVTLVQCPYWTREAPPMPLAVLSAYLRRHGHQVFNFDLNNSWYGVYSRYAERGKNATSCNFWSSEEQVSQFTEDNESLIEAAVSRIIFTGARVIGFSIYNSSSPMSIEIARRIKRRDKESIIIFGGVECSISLPNGCLVWHEAVDAVAIGEGEETLLEFVRGIEKNGKITDCAGIIYKKDGKVVNCGLRKPIADINALPYPDFSDFNADEYEWPNVLPVLSSRGCANDCEFCDTKSIWPDYRCMRGERLFAEIAHRLENSGNKIDYVAFLDCAINNNIKELKAYCDLAIEHAQKTGVRPVGFFGNATFNPKMTGEVLAKMKDAGCEYLTFGLESGSDAVISKMKKNFKVRDAERILRDTFEAGIKPTVNIMFGFPGETRRDFRQTLDFIRRNYRCIEEVKPSEALCYLNSRMTKNCGKFGISIADHPIYWKTTDGTNDYPERIRRYEEFCSLVKELGIRRSGLEGFSRESANSQALRSLIAEKNGLFLNILDKMGIDRERLSQSDDKTLLNRLNLAMINVNLWETTDFNASRLSLKYRDILEEAKVSGVSGKSINIRNKLILNRGILELLFPEIVRPDPALDRMLLIKDDLLRAYQTYLKSRPSLRR